MKELHGLIVRGSGQAEKSFGLPTANLILSEQDITPGVYATQARLDNTVYPALTFIGRAHLLEGKPWRCETHIFGASGDLVGKELHVTIVKKIRDPLEFTSEQQASDIIASDIKAARHYLKL